MNRKLYSALTILIAGAHLSSGYADTPPSMLLSCNVESNNFSDIKDKLFRKEVTLRGSQTTDQGKKKILVLGQYELWAETHMMSFTGKPQILDYVIKILDTKNNSATIASSGRYAVNPKLMGATLRIVNYDTTGAHEIGFINFSCDTLDVPDQPVFKMMPLN